MPDLEKRLTRLYYEVDTVGLCCFQHIADPGTWPDLYVTHARRCEGKLPSLLSCVGCVRKHAAQQQPIIPIPCPTPTHNPQLHTDVDLPLNKGENPTNLTSYLERSPYGEVSFSSLCHVILLSGLRSTLYQMHCTLLPLQFALELIATVFAVLLDSVGVRQGKFACTHCHCKPAVSITLQT